MATDALSLRNRVLAVALAGMAVPAAYGTAQQGKTSITCTNPASGVSWRIAIDFGKATVDSNRAAINEAKIAWFDPKDGSNNTLDRKSGDLTAIVASSTGGYFRRARCAVDRKSTRLNSSHRL